MEAVNLCKPLPGPGCRCVPGGDSQRETAAARDNAAHGKAPARWTCCCVRVGTKQLLRTTTQLLKMKFCGLCCASGVSKSQASPSTAEPRTGQPGAALEGRRYRQVRKGKNIHKVQCVRARITTFGSSSLWGQPTRTNYLTLLGCILLKPAITLPVGWEGWTGAKGGRK